MELTFPSSHSICKPMRMSRRSDSTTASAMMLTVFARWFLGWPGSGLPMPNLPARQRGKQRKPCRPAKTRETLKPLRFPRAQRLMCFYGGFRGTKDLRSDILKPLQRRAGVTRIENRREHLWMSLMRRFAWLLHAAAEPSNRRVSQWCAQVKSARYGIL
jgi:hypothetical protein